jgi:hypothetical protein
VRTDSRTVPNRPIAPYFLSSRQLFSCSSTLCFFAAAWMRFHAASRSVSLTSFTWLKRATALRTWLAFSRGSLRCFSNANSLPEKLPHHLTGIPAPPEFNKPRVRGNLCVLAERVKRIVQSVWPALAIHREDRPQQGQDHLRMLCR